MHRDIPLPLLFCCNFRGMFPVCTGIYRKAKRNFGQSCYVPCMHRDIPPVRDPNDRWYICSLYAQGYTGFVNYVNAGLHMFPVCTGIYHNFLKCDGEILHVPCMHRDKPTSMGYFQND